MVVISGWNGGRKTQRVSMKGSATETRPVAQRIYLLYLSTIIATDRCVA